MGLEIDSGNLHEIDSGRFGTWLEKQVQLQTRACGLAHSTWGITGDERATYLGCVQQPALRGMKAHVVVELESTPVVAVRVDPAFSCALMGGFSSLPLR